MGSFKRILHETQFKFKGFVPSKLDQLDAELYRKGFRGTPDFDNNIWSYEGEVTDQLLRIIRRSGGELLS